MITADFECPSHHVIEALVHWKQKKVKCPKCGKKAKRIISVHGQYMGNQDCDHVRSAISVLLDKEDKSQDAVKLRSHPTRDNLNRYLKDHGLSRMDHTEHGGPPVYHPRPEVDTTHLREEVARRHFERKRIEVRG
jgi:hypothetical protein